LRKVAEDRAAGGGQIRRPSAACDCGATRGVLLRLRNQGEIGDDAFHRIQEELDWAELDAAPTGTFQSLAT